MAKNVQAFAQEEHWPGASGTQLGFALSFRVRVELTGACSARFDLPYWF